MRYNKPPWAVQMRVLSFIAAHTHDSAEKSGQPVQTDTLMKLHMPEICEKYDLYYILGLLHGREFIYAEHDYFKITGRGQTALYDWYHYQ